MAPLDDSNTNAAAPAAAPTAPAAAPGQSVAAPADASAPPTMPVQSVPSTVPAISDYDSAIAARAPFIAGANDAAAALKKLNQPDAAAAPTRHARLMNMIQGLANGLATGLTAAGTSIGTGGKEGGAKEVAEIQGEQQRQKLAAKQQALEAKNQAIQHQVTLLDTNMKMAQMIPMLYSLKNDMTKSDLEISGEKQKQVGQEQDIRTKAWQDFLTTGDWNNYQGTLGKLGATTGATSGTPGTVPPMATTTWKSAVDSAAQAYPDDAVIKQQQAVFQNPQAAPQDQAMAARMAANRQSALDNAAKSQKLQGDAAEATAKATAAQTTNTAYQAYAKSVPAGTTPMGQKTWESQQADLAKEKTPLGAAQLTDAQAGAQLKQIALDVSKAMNNPATANLSGEDFIKTLPPAAQNSVRMVGQGRFPMSANMLRSPEGQQFLNLVARAYPNFKQANVDSYMKAQNDFTTGAIGTALNKGNAAVHGLETLKALNTDGSRIYGSAAYQKYNNQLNTLVGEIANFYQLPETDKTIEAIKSNLGSMFNRGAAIDQQMHQMGVKFDQFENQWNEASILPGTLPMPGTDAKAKQIVAGIDPEYKANHPELQAAGGAAAGSAAATPPAAPVGASQEVWVNKQLVGHVVNNQYVPLGK